MRLLVIFDTLYRTRSVSKTADQLGLSQPSVSLALNKLRKELNDPIFVRMPSGMEPTAYAQDIVHTLRHAMELMRTACAHQSVFVAAESTTTFRVSLTDITQIVVLPTLLERFQAHAPHVELEVRRYGPDTLRALAAGEIDLLVGNVSAVGAGFYEQTLLKRDFVCICSPTHPRIGDALTARQFSSEPQLLVASDASGLREAERAMDAQRIRRNIKVTVPDFLGIEPIIRNSDMIATVPRGVAQVFAIRGSLRSLEHPVQLPTYSVKQHWHERYHLDPRNQWLRRMVADVFAGDVLASARL